MIRLKTRVNFKSDKIVFNVNQATRLYIGFDYLDPCPLKDPLKFTEAPDELSMVKIKQDDQDHIDTVKEMQGTADIGIKFM